jgi:hypothetical protein
MLARGGYTVHPVPVPCSTKLLASSRPNAGGSNQKLTLFKRGNAMSIEPISSGIMKLLKPPINAGIHLLGIKKGFILRIKL